MQIKHFSVIESENQISIWTYMINCIHHVEEKLPICNMDKNSRAEFTSDPLKVLGAETYKF